MVPVIALVGRPNVGKSTLFNRLTRTRDALVADYPGLTRDRQYGLAESASGSYLVIDTGGLQGGEDSLEQAAESQTEQALAEADGVILLVDAKDGLAPGDLQIAALVEPDADRQPASREQSLRIFSSLQQALEEAGAEFEAVGNATHEAR